MENCVAGGWIQNTGILKLLEYFGRMECRSTQDKSDFIFTEGFILCLRLTHISRWYVLDSKILLRKKRFIVLSNCFEKHWLYEATNLSRSPIWPFLVWDGLLFLKCYMSWNSNNWNKVEQSSHNLFRISYGRNKLTSWNSFVWYFARIGTWANFTCCWNVFYVEMKRYWSALSIKSKLSMIN